MAPSTSNNAGKEGLSLQRWATTLAHCLTGPWFQELPTPSPAYYSSCDRTSAQKHSRILPVGAIMALGPLSHVQHKQDSWKIPELEQSSTELYHGTQASTHSCVAGLSPHKAASSSGQGPCLIHLCSPVPSTCRCSMKKSTDWHLEGPVRNRGGWDMTRKDSLIQICTINQG